MREYIEKIYNLEVELLKYSCTKEMIDNEIDNIKNEKEKLREINFNKEIS